MSRFAPIERLEVRYEGGRGGSVRVGELGWRARRVYFEYDRDFLDAGLELSPLHLPAEPGLKVGDPARFEGLFGLFDDSLPDGWGRLLLDRYVAGFGVRPSVLSPLDRLAWVGAGGIGALSYRPTHEVAAEPGQLDLHHLAEQARVVLEDRASEALPELLRLGGSPQGARPKALVLLAEEGETVISGTEQRAGFVPYLVKYPARADARTAGAVEYAYSAMARAAGIEMPETRLLGPRDEHLGFFAIERFDVRGGRRVHVHTASGLLHAPPGLTFITYEDLLRLTWQLTRDHGSVVALFRRAAFNVAAHNRDDHARNFSFEMDDVGRWSLAPAYDLTFSDGPGGEHTMTVAGEGKAPARAHLEKLGKSASLKRKVVDEVLGQVEAAVQAWPEHAEAAGLPERRAEQIGAHLGWR